LGLHVIYQRTYAQKVDLFKRLLTEIQVGMNKEIPVFEQFISNLTKAGKLRNQVIHADWESAYNDGYTLVKLKIDKQGLQHEYVQFSSESLENILKLINNTCDMFDQYEDEIGELFR
jgi:hypothetical protein